MEIGSRLKNARVEMGLTQEKVAEEIGVSRQSVSNWENNRSYPDIVSVIKLSDLYSVSLDELLKEDKKMIRHLEITASAEENRKRLFKWILIGVYAALWVLFIPFYWVITTHDGSPADISNILLNGAKPVYLLFYPIIMWIITLLIGAGGYFGALKWLFIPINGIMHILSFGVTCKLEDWLYRLSSVAYQTKTEQPFVLGDFLKDYLTENEIYEKGYPLAGIIAAAAGLLIGTLIRQALVIKRIERNENNNAVVGEDADV